MTRTYGRGVVWISLALSLGCASTQDSARLSDPEHSSETTATQATLSSEERGLSDPIPLSRVLAENLDGMRIEPPSASESLKAQAEEYLRWKRSFSRKSVHPASCTTAASNPQEENPFCLLAPARSASSKRTRRTRVSRKVIASVRRSLRKGDLQALARASESELIAALKGRSGFSGLQGLSEKLLSEDGCRSSALYAALGMKAESEFPEETYRELAESLYGRAVQCEPSTSFARAAFRLGMMKVWRGDLQEADRLFAKIQDLPEAKDYLSRVLYWRIQAAKAMADQQLERSLLERLLREAPLSLHALLAGGAPTLADLPVVSAEDPLVQFRSGSEPGLNAIVRAAEALQSLGMPDDSFQALELGLEQVRKAEIPFQLYYSVLLMRSGDILRKFSLMTAILREQPGLITKSTLEMLYPLRDFELIRNTGAAVDPFLVISLIRQESAFNQRAVSRAGARGLMQLMPATARRMERRVSKRQLFDPETNVRIGVKYFSYLLELYEGDVEHALAAYNAGPLRVNEWKQRYPTDNRLVFLDLIPFKETREYVASIARNYYWYLRLYEMERLQGSKEDGGRVPASRTFRVFNTSAKRELK